MRILRSLGVAITFSFIFRVVFICICAAFTSNYPFSSPQTLFTSIRLAAFLILITEVFCGISVEWQTKRRSCFTTFTQLSQLILSLAGILKQRFEL